MGTGYTFHCENSDLSRLNEVTDEDLQRLEKYKKAREILLEEEA